MSLLPDGLRGRLDTGAAGTAKAGVVLVAAEPGLQDQVTVGQLRLVDTVPAGVPGLGGQHCETPGGERVVRKFRVAGNSPALSFP